MAWLATYFLPWKTERGKVAQSLSWQPGVWGEPPSERSLRFQEALRKKAARQLSRSVVYGAVAYSVVVGRDMMPSAGIPSEPDAQRNSRIWGCPPRGAPVGLPWSMGDPFLLSDPAGRVGREIAKSREIARKRREEADLKKNWRFGISAAKVPYLSGLLGPVALIDKLGADATSFGGAGGG